MSFRKLFTSQLPLVIVLLLTTVIFLPMLYHWRDTGDFRPHTVYIDRILAGDNAVFYETPNFLYHLGILALHFIFPAMNITALVVIVSLAWYWLLAVAIYSVLSDVFIVHHGRDISRPYSIFIIIGTTLALLVITPITFLTPENQYFGYMTPYVYHNPTMIPLRPLSLILFVVGVWVFRKNTPPLHVWRGGRGVRSGLERGQGGEDDLTPPQPLPIPQGGAIVLTALLTLACILAKPSFVMIFLPALAIVTLWRLLFRQPIDWFLLIGGIVLPAVGLLGYQALTWTDGGMALVPFETFRLWDYHYDPNTSANLGLKLLLSLLFPMVIYGVYLPQARRDVLFNLAWLCALTGTIFSYLFIDTGDPVAGNLTWNGQIGVFVLYIAAVLFFLRHNHALFAGKIGALSWRFWLCWLIFGLHLVSGIMWYWLHLNGIWPDIIYGIW
jgi:hypothetical protein